MTGPKPTWGRVSRDGTFELAASLDHVGVMARSAADVELLLRAVAGPDPRDPTALQALCPRRSGGISLAGVIVGVDRAWNEDGVDEPARQVVAEASAVLDEFGASIFDVSVPDIAGAVADWPEICAAEAAVAHADTFPSRRLEYGPVLAGVLDRGLNLSATDVQRALLRRMDLRGRFAAIFTRIDLLLCPVQPFAPLTLEALGAVSEKPEMIARLQQFTCPFDLTGSPALTLPGGQDENGMPISFQLVGADLTEPLLTRAGIAFQSATDWHRRHPREVQR